MWFTHLTLAVTFLGWCNDTSFSHVICETSINTAIHVVKVIQSSFFYNLFFFFNDLSSYPRITESNVRIRNKTQTVMTESASAVFGVTSKWNTANVPLSHLGAVVSWKAAAVAAMRLSPLAWWERLPKLHLPHPPLSIVWSWGGRPIPLREVERWIMFKRHIKSFQAGGDIEKKKKKKEEITGRQKLKIEFGKTQNFVWSGRLFWERSGEAKGGGGGGGGGWRRGEEEEEEEVCRDKEKLARCILSLSQRWSWSQLHADSCQKGAVRVRSRQATQDGEVLETFRQPLGGRSVHGKHTAFNSKSRFWPRKGAR